MGRKHIHNGQIQALDQADLTSEKEAIGWFNATLMEMLDKDPSGHFRFESWERWLGGWVNQTLPGPTTAADLQDASPNWYKGPGIYDDQNKLVFGDNEPMPDRLTIADWTYFVTRLDLEPRET